MPRRSAGRVARRHYCLPAPSEPGRLVSSHPAHASGNALPVGGHAVNPIGLGTNLGVTTAVPATEMTAVAAGAPATAITAVPTSLQPSLRRLADASRPPTPEGSRPAFAGGDVPTPSRPITSRRSLAPSSSTRSPVGRPYDLPTRKGGLRDYHVPLTEPSGLGRVSGPVARPLRPGSVAPRRLATHLLVPAGQQLVGPLQRDRLGLLNRTALATLHLG
jgi:hypothetical protein